MTFALIYGMNGYTVQETSNGKVCLYFPLKGGNPKIAEASEQFKKNYPNELITIKDKNGTILGHQLPIAVFATQAAERAQAIISEMEVSEKQ